MPFPALPSAITPADGSDKFLITDPFGLRRSVLPLLDYDIANNVIRGWGTCFRVDPFGTVVTAYHVIGDFIVIDDSQSPIDSRFGNDRGLCGLESPGIVYGRSPIPNEKWTPVKDARCYVSLSDDRFVHDGIRNFCETAVLEMSPRDGKAIRSLPVDLSYQPSIGERLLAIGFAELGVAGPARGNTPFIVTEPLFGSFGIVADMHPCDPGSGRPWPKSIVDADWQPGMSGGPVFNESGHVIGLVSTSISSAAISTAVWFGGWNIYESLMYQLDPMNPGMLQGWGIIDESGTLRVFHTGSHSNVVQQAKYLGLGHISHISWEFGTTNMSWTNVPLDQVPS